MIGRFSFGEGSCAHGAREARKAGGRSQKKSARTRRIVLEFA